MTHLRRTPAVLLALLLCAAPALAQKFVAPDGKWGIDFPSNPEVSPSNGTTKTGDPYKGFDYVLVTDEPYIYSVSTTDYTKAQTRDDLQAMVNAFVKDGEILHQISEDIDGHPGIMIVATNSLDLSGSSLKIKVIAWFLAVGNRTYIIAFACPLAAADQVPSDTPSKFIGSFVLLGGQS
jgi:hypothetical protein